MDNISNEIKAKLKRLCPYIGSNIPDFVTENAKQMWPGPCMDESAGWHWDDGSGIYQCGIELCDMDADYIDPAGYVAIRPLGQGKCTLIFVISSRWADGFDPSNLIFQTMQGAKRYLDTLLAAETPEIPLNEINPGSGPGDAANAEFDLAAELKALEKAVNRLENALCRKEYREAFVHWDCCKLLDHIVNQIENIIIELGGEDEDEATKG